MSAAVLDNDTSVILDADIKTDSGDHDKFSHYVAKDKIIPSAIEGTPMEAICGKIWVPNSDPSRYAVCPSCTELMDKQFGPEGEDE